MRVICIESTTWAYSKKPEEIGTLSVQKGSIYHVTGSVQGYELRKDEKFCSAGDGTWYELLELKGWHHSTRFLEIPDDDLKEGNQKEQIESEEAFKHFADNADITITFNRNN
jgi:hypothetical protein